MRWKCSEVCTPYRVCHNNQFGLCEYCLYLVVNYPLPLINDMDWRISISPVMLLNGVIRKYCDKSNLPGAYTGIYKQN